MFGKKQMYLGLLFQNLEEVIQTESKKQWTIAFVCGFYVTLEYLDHHVNP